MPACSIERARPAVVFVGLPFPLQEPLVERLRLRFPDVWFLGVGVSLSSVAGDVRRASRLMQRTGPEWIWRVTQELRRLFRRYLVDGVPFAPLLLAWGCAARLRRSFAR